MLSASIKQINALFNKLDDKSEFEIMFNNYNNNNKQTIIKFMNVLNYAKWRSEKEKLKIVNETILDVVYSPEYNLSYRISISGIERINNILNLVHQRQNHIIMSILSTQFYKTDGITFISKKLDKKNIVDNDQHDIRFRLSSEEHVTKKDIDFLSNIQYNECDKISYRYKQRVSLYLSEKDNVKLDLTFVKCSNNPNDLIQASNSYEIEIDYSPNEKKVSDKVLQMILKEVGCIKQVLEDTDEIISKDESNNIIAQYKKISFGFENNTSTQLYSMKPISAEVQHIVDKIPNKYCVSDKADGEHFVLFLYNSIVYLLSNNLVVRKTNYIVKDVKNCIFEGELIYLDKYNKYLFMIYDCMYYDGKDCRNETNFMTRLKYIENLMELMNIKTHKVLPYVGDFDIIKQEEYYQKEIHRYYKNMNTIMDGNKEGDILFHPKIFLFPTGGSNTEVYSFANLIWAEYTNNTLINCRYNLDGIIFTGINQKYTHDKKEQKHPIYKYKPPVTNSIDVYIMFPKNIDTNTFIDMYDNSVSTNNKVFRVVNFFVGDCIGTIETPVPFMKEENNHEAYCGLDRGEVRDVEGNIVNDNTVVEIIYVNDNLIPHQYRWKILRTRWDKTESVLRYKKSYGNFKDVAMKVWKSIREAITIDEIKKLAREDTYAAMQKQLASRIDTKIISSERAQDTYYQKITNLGKSFRNFHGWIKSNMIYTYCSPNNINGKNIKKNVLDIGIGRGGDIMKYYSARVNECVGLDVVYEDLFGSIDSATTRYQTNKTKYPYFTNFKFIQADARLPLVSSIQEKRLVNMTPENKKLIDSVFNNKNQFDIISIQFSLHYFFDNINSVDNFINTVKTCLKTDGYLLCTLFDPVSVIKLLNDKDTVTSYYTSEDGQRNKFFEIIKKFEGDVKDDVGQSIDVHMDWISQEGLYITEYLVTPKLLIDTMKKANCMLVETDLFVNTYNINKDWIDKVIEYEHNPKNKVYYESIKAFYGELKGVDKESKVWNDLFRFYVFKKI
jgi:SAM-dependent methyltransferase